MVVFALMAIRLIWMLPSARGPAVVVNPFGIRDLRIGDEFLPWNSIAVISAEERRGHKMIVLTPTPDLQWHLRACRDAYAASTPRTALQQEDERDAQGGALKASPHKRHKIAAPGSLCCNAG